MTLADPRPFGVAGSDLILRFIRDPVGDAELVQLDGAEPVPALPFTPDPDLFFCARAVQKHGQSACPDLDIRLWGALPETIRSALEEALERTPYGDRLRLVLWSDEACPSRFLPWELLCFGERGFPQATKRLVMLRYVHREPNYRDPERIDEGDRLRVLVLVGDQQQLWRAPAAEPDVLGALAEISHGMAKLGPLCELKIGGPGQTMSGLGETSFPCQPLTSVEEVRVLVHEFDPHILVFVGHSDGHDPVDPLDPVGRPAGTSALRFRFKTGRDALPQDLPIVELKEVVRDRSCRAIVLGACLIQDHLARDLLDCVDHVIAMGGRPTPECAARFLSGLARNLFARRARSVGEVVTHARSRLYRAGKSKFEFWLPIHWTSSLDDQPLLDAGTFALRQYLDGVAAECRSLGGPLTQHLEVEDPAQLLARVYVELDIGWRSTRHGKQRREVWHDKGPNGRAAEALLAGRATLSAIIRLGRRDSSWITRRWALLGDAADGKTTVLRNLARMLAEERPHRLVPIYRPIQSLIDGKINSLDKLALETPLEDHPTVLSFEAKRGGVLLLLDGLDEVEDRRAAETLIRRFEQELPNAVLVIASRRVGYRRPGVAGRDGVDMHRGFREIELKGLLPEDRDELIKKWFAVLWRSRQNFKHLASFDDPQEAAGVLRRKVQDTPPLQYVTTNPLCVALLAQVFAEDGKLPTRRHELITRFIDYLLHRSHHQANVVPKDPALAAWKVLREIALSLTEAGTTRLVRPRGNATRDPDPMLDIVRSVRDTGLFAADAPWGTEDEFVRYLWQRAGLFVEKSPGSWGFALAVFQDALAAEEVVERTSGRVNVLLDYVRTKLAPVIDGDEGDAPQSETRLDRWAECVAFVTGHLEERRVDSWLRGLTKIDVDFGYRALAYADTVDPELFTQMLGLSDDRAQRRLAIEGLGQRARDERVLFALLSKCATATRDGDDLWVIDDTLNRHAWQSSELRARAVRVVEEEIRKWPTVELDSFDWVRVPTPSEQYGDPKRDWFWMGNPNRRHQQQLRESFYIGKVPVTVGQYRLFDPTKAQALHELYAPEEITSLDPDLPVLDVTWRAANMFCRWLTYQFESSEKRVLARLPQEVEWEWACRAGYEGQFGFDGDEFDLPRYAWFRENSKGDLQKVALLEANRFGIHDMHGLVLEWCKADSEHCARGGSYRDDALGCRAASRYSAGPFWCLGFRVVLSMSP